MYRFMHGTYTSWLARRAYLAAIASIWLTACGCLYGQSQGPALRIMSPLSGQSFPTGSTVSVKVEVGSPGQFTEGIYIFGALLRQGHNLMQSAPFETSFTVPAETTPGLYQIVAAGVSTTGVVESQPVSLRINSGYSFESLLVEPLAVELRYAGDRAALQVRGRTVEGRTVYLTKDTKLVGTIENNKIAAYEKGAVVAVGPGSTTLRVGYAQHVVELPVTVASVKRGDLDADGDIDVDDLNEMQVWIGSVTRSLNDSRDLNGDGRIDALDMRVLTTLCTRTRCGVR